MRIAQLIICLTFVLSARPLLADDPPPATQPSKGESQVIDAADKAAIDGAMGKEVVIEGVVESAAWSQTGKVMLVRFQNSKETYFACAVFEKKKADFDSAFGGDVTKALPGAKVRVRGTIKDFRGHPEILLDVPAQITIVEPPPSTQPGK
jgi:DNA/RNA endonuclease YhcR with UshA esterase domain